MFVRFVTISEFSSIFSLFGKVKKYDDFRLIILSNKKHQTTMRFPVSH